MVQRALETLMKGRTTIMVAHRLSTIRNVDRIYVIVRGKVAEQGSHDELLSINGEFARLYNLQFSDHSDADQLKQACN
jgi:ABC-type multidrug transport system fused ATPase/permease subunit